MKKSLILFAVGVFALLYSCGDNTQDNISIGEATLYLNVQDGSNGDALPEATATLGSAKGTTDSKGLVKLKIQAGSHMYVVEKQGYATIRGDKLFTDVGKGVSVIEDVYDGVELYPLSAKLTGTLYFKNSQGKNVPMPGMPIRVEMNSLNLDQTAYSCGVTNDKGEYVCTGLPAIGNNIYSVYALGVEIAGVKYPAVNLSNAGALLPDISTNNGRADYNASRPAFTLLEKPSSRIELQNIDKELVFTFTEAVDTALFKTDWIRVYDYTSGGNSAVKIEWDACYDAESEKKVCSQLKISPIPNWGKSGSRTGVQFTGLMSVSGKTYGNTFEFVVADVDISGKQVEGVVVLPYNASDKVIKHSETAARIIWNKVEGATSYEVFVRYQDSANYVKANVLPINDTTYFISRINGEVQVPVKYAWGFNPEYRDNPIAGNVNDVVVQAVNNSSKSKFSALAQIKATDDSAPTFADKNVPIFSKCGDYNGQAGYEACKSGYLLAPPTNWDNVPNGIVYIYRDKWNLSMSPSEFAEAPEVQLADKLGDPKAIAELSPGKVFFSRPMDVSVAPSVTCIPAGDAGCKKLKLAAKWDGPQSLDLVISTVAGEVVPVGTGIDITYVIAGLKSPGTNGKLFVANPTAAVASQVNAVKLRFTTATIVADPCDDPDYAVANSTCPDYCTYLSNQYNSTCISTTCGPVNSIESTDADECLYYYCSEQEGNSDTDDLGVCPSNSYCTNNPAASVCLVPDPCDDPDYAVANSTCPDYCTYPSNQYNSTCISTTCGPVNLIESTDADECLYYYCSEQEGNSDTDDLGVCQSNSYCANNPTASVCQ